MSDISYLYFYRNTVNGALVQSTSPCEGASLVEVTKVEHDREVRRRQLESADAVAAAAAERATKRAALADKLGITPQEMTLLA